MSLRNIGITVLGTKRILNNAIDPTDLLAYVPPEIWEPLAQSVEQLTFNP